MECTRFFLSGNRVQIPCGPRDRGAGQTIRVPQKRWGFRLAAEQMEEDGDASRLRLHPPESHRNAGGQEAGGRGRGWGCGDAGERRDLSTDSTKITVGTGGEGAEPGAREKLGKGWEEGTAVASAPTPLPLLHPSLLSRDKAHRQPHPLDTHPQGPTRKARGSASPFPADPRAACSPDSRLPFPLPLPWAVSPSFHPQHQAPTRHAVGA